jgi:hypothetical protein
MEPWSPEQFDIQKLRNLALYSWDTQTKKKTVDALASYQKNALPALTDVATLVVDTEIRAYVLDKIKEINEGKK